MDASGATDRPKLEIGPTRKLGPGAVVAINMYGLLLGIPVLLAFAWVSFRPLDAGSYLAPVLAVALATFFLPLGFGNLHVRMIARGLQPPFAREQARIVQLTMQPRLRGGLRALLEDADDVGYLHIGDKGMVFFGDSVRLEIPFVSVEKLSLVNIGFRGLFVYAPRIAVQTGGPNPKVYEFADRQSLVLTAARSKTRRLHTALLSKIPAAQERV